MNRELPAVACFEHYHPINDGGEPDGDAICAACEFEEGLKEMIDCHAYETTCEHDEPLSDDLAFLSDAWSEAETELRDLFVSVAGLITTHQGNRKLGDNDFIAMQLVDIYILLDSLRVALEVEHPAECVK